MIDDERLHEMLKRATATGLEVPVDLDAETASLREAWLSLGRKLAAAETVAPAPREWLSRTPPRERAIWPQLVLLATAASLLIIVGAALLRYRGPNLVENTGPRPAGANSQADAADPPVMVAGGKKSSETTKAEKSSSYWEWDEQLDSEIDEVAQAATWREAQGPGYSDAYLTIGQDILRMQEDVNDGTF